MKAQGRRALFSGENLSVEEDDWHYPYYIWRQKHTKRSANHMPNLCRYFWSVVMTIFVFIPSHYFFVKPVYKGFSPATFVLPPIIIGIITYCYWMWTAIMWAITKFLMALGITLVVMVFFIIAATYVIYEDIESETLRPWVIKFKKKFRGFFTQVRRGFRWYFKYGKKGIYPWSVTILAVLAVGAWVLGLEISLTVLAVAITMAVIIFMCVLVAGLVVLFINWVTKPRKPKTTLSTTSSITSKSVVSPKPKGTPTAILVGSYVMAKKRKVCPLITLPKA